jgi:hypothetical protein
MAMFIVKPWYAKKDDLKIVPFSTGTDAQIKAMLDAYYDDKITWQDMGWAVGDTRLIHLNAMQAPNPDSSKTWVAQDITVVIVAHDHTDLTTPINGHTKACITVQTREVMGGTSAGNSGRVYRNGNSEYDLPFTKWSNLYMRTYMNDKVLGAFPIDFKSAIKTSKHHRHIYCNTYDSETVNDNLFLPSYPEIFGTRTYSYYAVTSPVEGTQFAYYATSENRKKYINNNGSPSSGVTWWLGSASSNIGEYSSYSWCAVGSSGLPSNYFGNASEPFAPAWAM